MTSTSHRRIALLTWALLSLLALAGKVAAADDGGWKAPPYRLGQGLYLPSLGLHLGGYANLHYYDLAGHRPAWTVHDVSLFLTKDIGTRWKLFSEVELADGVTRSGGHTSTRNAEFDVERLYADYHASASVTVRLGKFLTPVGQWNLVHADPLVWTVSRPLTTSAAFARHATGAMAYGTLRVAHHDLDYWVFGDDSDDLAPANDRDLAFSDYGADSTLHNNFRHALGARVLYHVLDDRLSLGASYLRYELAEPQRQYHLTGVDFSLDLRHVTLSGEGIYRSGGNEQVPDEYGGFVQAVVPVIRRVYLVGRYERYRSSTLDRITTLRTLGVDWRPVPGLAVKLEHRGGSHNATLAPDGWLASFAVLF